MPLADVIAIVMVCINICHIAQHRGYNIYLCGLPSAAHTITMAIPSANGITSQLDHHITPYYTQTQDAPSRVRQDPFPGHVQKLHNK